MLITTRCLAESGPAAATDVSVTAATIATSVGLIPFESGRLDLSLKREVLLMKCDFLRPWLMTMVKVAHG